MYALIGGSGFEGNDVIRVTEEVEMTTPYGAPSAPIVFGTLGGVEIAFLRRHGVRHEYAPHRVPYRANLWALSKLKLSGVIAVGTVGGIAPALGPGALAVPDQLIDYTWGREVTYFDSPETGVRHVDMTWPFDRSLSRRLVMAAGRLGVAVEEKGVYAATQGPRLETAAEVERMRRDGADMNRAFAAAIGGETLAAYELFPDMEGVPLQEICAFEPYFKTVIATGEELKERRIRGNDRTWLLSIYNINPKKQVLGVLQNLHEPSVRKEWLIEKTREVLGNHMTTVQKIAGLLGENAAYTDATLRSIIEAYDRGVEEIPTKHPSEE